jgi:tryptophan synthase alpha chain
MLHLVANYPDPESFVQILEVILESQVAYLEIQLPYYNPLGDGPLIFEANSKALEFNHSLERIADSISQVFDPKKHSTKLALMSYFTPIYGFGLENFVKVISPTFQSVIIPDLAFGSSEHLELNQLCKDENIHIIPVISSNISPKRLEQTKEYLNPGQVVYCIARFGKTGQTTDLVAIQKYLDKVKTGFNQYQVAVGFGINNSDQIKTRLQNSN